MKLTQYFSRIRADGEFLHNEGMNLPLQGDESRPEGSNEAVQSVLQDRCGGVTGPEKSRKLSSDVTVFSDPYGSYRFVKTVDGKPVAGIQVMSHGPPDGHVTKAYTLPQYRRKGYASRLVQYAHKIFTNLSFSDDRSPEGEAFVTGDP